MSMSRVHIEPEGIFIDGKAEIVLCSSLFYFRIPRSMWRDRMEKVKSSGYNCIDVYFPWNFHEEAEGLWDFTNERNVSEYLKLAAEYKLWVIARPGPYICSEWDGGGLPAYLSAKSGLKIRDFEIQYLKYVREWYSRIMPIISKFQYDNGGTVIAVQIENELDFYDCSNVEEYMKVLREMAKEFGVSVPIVACAGQGDIKRAGGTIEGVVPALNLYPDNYDEEFENKLIHVYKEFKNLGFPVCVTETNRLHSLLKRLLLNGVKFIAPYNQVGGTDFGFTTSINNWGRPLSLLTHDYDFGGMISPQGKLNEEFYEGRLLSGLISAFGEELALSEPEYKHDFKVTSDFKLTNNSISALRLKGGGYLLGIANVDHRNGRAQLSFEDMKIPRYSFLKIDEQRCQIILRDIPLNPLNIIGKINYSTGEIAAAEIRGNTTIIVLYSDYEGEISIAVEGKERILTENVKHFNEKDSDVFVFNSNEAGKAVFYCKDGKRFIIKTCSRREASRFISITDNGDIILPAKELSEGQDFKRLETVWTWNGRVGAELLDIDNRLEVVGNHMFMEELGFYRGYAWYRGERILGEEISIKGYIIHNAADIVSVYINGKYHGIFTPGGNCVFIEDENTSNRIDAVIRTEIWGHSNFDDSRLPALKIDSLKGMCGMTIVTNTIDLSRNWRYFEGKESEYSIISEKPGDSLRPMLTFGTFNNPRQPQTGFYKKRVKASSNAESYILKFNNLKSAVEVYVDGRFIQRLNEYIPYIVLDGCITPGKEHELIIKFEQKYIEESKGMGVMLYEGIKVQKWSVSGAEEKDLWKLALKTKNEYKSITLPIQLRGGDTGWIISSLDIISSNCSYIARAKGKNIKLSFFVNDHMLGRLWLKEDKSAPFLTGGRPDTIYMPADWLVNGENVIACMVEAVDPLEVCEITEIIFEEC